MRKHEQEVRAEQTNDDRKSAHLSERAEGVRAGKPEWLTVLPGQGFRQNELAEQRIGEGETGGCEERRARAEFP